jgi:hypothetical protein
VVEDNLNAVHHIGRTPADGRHLRANEDRANLEPSQTQGKQFEAGDAVMIPAIRNWTCDEMMKRVAFFRDLKGSKTGLPDSDLPECERELINVIGFHPDGYCNGAVAGRGVETT